MRVRGLALCHRPQPVGDSGVMAGQFTGFATNGWLEEVEFDSHKAAWTDGNLLLWEKDNISCIVGGPTLTLEDAIQIADSLR